MHSILFVGRLRDRDLSQPGEIRRIKATSLRNDGTPRLRLVVLLAAAFAAPQIGPDASIFNEASGRLQTVIRNCVCEVQPLPGSTLTAPMNYARWKMSQSRLDCIGRTSLISLDDRTRKSFMNE